MSEPVKVVIEVQEGIITAVLAGVPLDVLIMSCGDPEIEYPLVDSEFSDGTSVSDFMRGSATRDFL